MRGKAAQDSRGDGAVKRRGASLSADVSQRDAQLLRAIGEKIVQIAANFPRGKNSRGDVQAEIDARHGAQQGVLQALRGGELALHARFILGQLFVQARIFERNRQVRGQDHQRLLMIFGEIIHLRAFEIEDAHDAALDESSELPARNAFPG